MQTARIEEVIGEFVQLKRAGSNLKGLSPFTDEKSPSFMVSPAKQIFKDFSTGKGGSVVTFLMEKEHFSYPEALKWLANRYQIELPKERELNAEELAAVTERESLQIINEFAKDHFVHNLHHHQEGQAIGLSYFEERGFRKDIIEKFQLGYSLNISDALTQDAQKKGYKLEYLEKLGLSKSKEDRHFDFFRGRVMFPIHGVSGKVLGFGGRTLITDKKVAKYFNSPESIIYNKSEILYGLFFSKSDIIKYDNCFLCEGYTDVISLYQAGIQNVVSSSGTALTKDQIKLIRRYTNNITILYDGDAAGIKASFRGIDLILEEGLNVKVVLFPEGEDPDSYAKSHSSSELELYLKEHAQDFISFKADILLKDADHDPLKKAELIKDIVHSVSLIPDAISRSIFAQQISNQFHIDEKVIEGELLRLKGQALRTQHSTSSTNFKPEENVGAPIQPPSTNSLEPSKEGINPFGKTIYIAEYDLIRLLVTFAPHEVTVEQINEKNQKEIIKTSATELILFELERDEITFKTPLFQSIYEIYKSGLLNNELYQSSFLLKNENQEIVKFVSQIEMNDSEISHQWSTKYNVHTRTEGDRLYEAIMHSIYFYKASLLEYEIEEIREQLKSSNLDSQQMNDLLAEQILKEKIKRAFTNKLGRIILR